MNRLALLWTIKRGSRRKTLFTIPFYQIVVNYERSYIFAFEEESSGNTWPLIRFKDLLSEEH